MNSFLRRCACCLIWALLFSLAQPDVARADKRLVPRSEVGPRYRKQWALVVGVNYNRPPDRGKPEPLLRAEGDARAFHNLLLQNYGYAADRAKLLLGPAATKEAIEKDLSESFLCHPEEVEEADSVLFFFSGHGYLKKDREGRSETGTLFPDDVEFAGNNEPISAKTIEMEWVVKQLSQSKARHKLIVLDCCHSGAIFDQGHVFRLSAGRLASPFDERLDRGVFQVPGVQALSASRKWQVAIDGPATTRGESEQDVADVTRPVSTLHSPFSYALIRALQTIPRRHGLRHPITASSLFRSMRAEFRYDPLENQTPQCQWLSVDQGEFHFFPRGEFPDDAIPDERAQQMLVAMVPGVFGNWWFEETPWLLPSLREEIVKQLELKRSTDLEIFERGRLRRAAQQAISELRSYEDQLIKRRVAHLDALLQEAETDRTKTFQRLAAELQQATGDGTAGEPVDLHFLAVLLQALDQSRDAVDAAYQAAIAGYEKIAESHPRYMPLLALCYADYGWFLQQWLHRYEDAAEYFHRARRGVFADNTPVPFQVFTLSREAFAYLELGRWNLADETMQEAIRLAEKFDPGGTHPFLAATHSRRAWASLQQWRIGDAKQSFAQANQTLNRLLVDQPENYEALTARFHNDHGLAMTQRFAGDTGGALAAYRRLSPRIAAELETHVRNAAGRDLNFTEVHHRLAERWVNTLERQRDCCLFGDQPDFAEAADDYRRALVSCDALAKNRQADWRVRLLYKRAIALSMPSPVQDLELAQGLSRLAEQVLNDEELSLEKQPAAVRFQARLAAALLAVPAEGGGLCSGATCDALRESVRAQMRDRSGQRNIPRDELESLMFAAKTLLGRETDRARIEQTADWLLAFCRLACSSETLGYLRPYYEAVMEAKLRMKPKHVKDLIEIAWEATQGDAYRKPEGGSPRLAFFVVGDECYLFLDTPRGLSKSYCLREYADLATVQKASLTGRLLPLPQELKRDLETLPHAWRIRLVELDPLAVHWQDPVRGVGAAPGERSGGVQVVYKPIVGDGAETLLPTVTAGSVFPFDLANLRAD